MSHDDHGTHGTPGPSDDVESVTTDQPGDPKNVGKSVQHQGHKLADEHEEEGRHGQGAHGSTQRPDGKSDSRDSTGVDPKGPIDPDSPHLIPS